MPYLYFSQFYLFLSIELNFHLPSAQMTFFTTSCVVLLKLNSSNFSISEEVFTLPSFLKVFSLVLEFRLKFFSLVFKDAIHLLSSCFHYFWKEIFVILIYFFLYIICLFSWAAFKIFFLCFTIVAKQLEDDMPWCSFLHVSWACALFSLKKYQLLCLWDFLLKPLFNMLSISSTFLTVLDIVIITVSMSLFASSVICVTGGLFQLPEFYSHCGTHFLLLVCLVISYWFLTFQIWLLGCYFLFLKVFF